MTQLAQAMTWQVADVETLGDDRLAALELASISPSVHFLAFATLLDKQGKLVRPCEINVLQRRMFQVYEIMQHIGLPTHLLVLKGRQSGGSTGAAEIMYHHCRRYGCRAACIADIFPNSDNIYNIFCRFADNDDFPWASSWSHNSEVGRFSNSSWIEKLTAENPNSGISGTRQAIWKSEVAKWAEEGVRDARKTNSNLMASLNKTGPNSLEIEESTPEGASGLFYEHWQEAVTLEEWIGGKRGNGMIKVFAAWHEHDEHSHDGRDGRPSLSERQKIDIIGALSDREKRGVQLYGWTPAQIAWRRATLSADCDGDEVLFDMHYPEDDISCFAASGRPRFAVEGLANLKLLLSSVMVNRWGLLTAQADGLRSVTFRETSKDDGWFEVSESPRVGFRYLLVVDPMTGAENTRGSDPDMHSVLLYRAACIEEASDGSRRLLPMMRVARIKFPCRWDNDRLADCIALMSRYYGGCMTVVEKNKGELIIDKLRELGVPLYRFEAVDRLTGKVQNYYGWHTDEQSKHRATERLAALVRETTVQKPMIIVDEQTLAEMRTFVVDNKGRCAGRGSCHDDDVLATMMAAECIESATMLHETFRTRHQPRDRQRWMPVN